MLKFTAKTLLTLTLIGAPLYLVRFSVYTIPTNALEILMILSIVVVFAACYKQQSYNSRALIKKSLKTLCHSRIALAALMMVCGALLSTWHNDLWRVGLGIIKGWFVLPLFFALSAFFALKHTFVSRTHLFRALIVGGTIVALVGLSYVFFEIFTYDHRLRALYLSPNHLAMALAPIIPLAFGGFVIARVYHYSAQTRVFLSFVLPLLFCILYLTRSFGGILAAGAGALFFLVAYYRSVYVFFIALSVALCTSVIILTTLWHTPRVQDFFTLPERSSLASRIMVWHATWDIGIDHPFLGIGPGNFQETYLSYQKNYPPYLEWAVPQPHNLYLAFWLQTGLIGLTGLFVLIYTLIQNYQKIIRKKTFTKNDVIVLAALGALFSIFLHGLIDTPYWKNDLALIFWMLVVLTIPTQPQKERL